MNAREAFEAFLTPPKSPEFSRETRILSQAALSRVRLGPNGFARGGDAEVQVYSWGTGPAVLFVHGWGGSAGNHYAGIEAVLQAGGRAVAFDAPGHGRSEGTLSCAPAFAWALAGVAAHVGELRGIVAHSLGAAATCIALRRGVRAPRAVLMASACWVAPVLRQYTDRHGFSEELAEDVQRVARRRCSGRMNPRRRTMHGTCTKRAVCCCTIPRIVTCRSVIRRRLRRRGRGRSWWRCRRWVTSASCARAAVVERMREHVLGAA